MRRTPEPALRALHKAAPGMMSRPEMPVDSPGVSFIGLVHIWGVSCTVKPPRELQLPRHTKGFIS